MDANLPESYLRWIRPKVKARLGVVRHALFDFDGTISTLRQGWEAVMAPVMVEVICGDHLPTPEIEAEVDAYIDRSTGILTIRQMEWLAEAVARHGLNGIPKSPQAYKQVYLERLMVQVSQRVNILEQGDASPLDFSIRGAIDFCRGLAERGVQLYLASGTDHHFVVREAKALGLLEFFEGGVYGALDESEAHAKERVIHEILARNYLGGSELLVVGDGPVELKEASGRGAIALGVASDEVRRQGWNEQKVPRLVNAGADLLVPDFSNFKPLIDLFTHSPR
jgi:phosphoglycolate phosphatase-like HAD superfamily hydrolase